MKPYYQDKWVTIYHLRSLPKCDKLSLYKCTEVKQWIVKSELDDIEQDYEGNLYQNRNLAPNEVTSKLQNTYKGENDLEQSITHIKARILLLNLGELELCVAILSNLAKNVVVQKLRDITRMAIRETIVQRMSDSYAEDAICLRMEG